MNARLLTRADVAAIAGVSENAVAVAARQKRLGYVKVGNRYRFREVDVEAWIESMSVPARVPRLVAAQPTPLAAARAAKVAR